MEVAAKTQQYRRKIDVKYTTRAIVVSRTQHVKVR